MTEQEVIKDAIEMYDSLQYAISETGGSGFSFRPENLLKMSVIELITVLAPNKIRFQYIGDKKKLHHLNEKD